MNGIEGAVEKEQILSKISNPKEFAQYVNHTSKVHSLYLLADEISPDPEEVTNANTIPDTLRTICIICGLSKHGIPYVKFFS